MPQPATTAAGVYLGAGAGAAGSRLRHPLRTSARAAQGPNGRLWRSSEAEPDVVQIELVRLFLLLFPMPRWQIWRRLWSTPGVILPVLTLATGSSVFEEVAAATIGSRDCNRRQPRLQP